MSIVIFHYLIYSISSCTYHSVFSQKRVEILSKEGLPAHPEKNILQMDSNPNRSLSNLLRLQTSNPGHILIPLPGTLGPTLSSLAYLFTASLYFPAPPAAWISGTYPPMCSHSPMYIPFTALLTWNHLLVLFFTRILTLQGRTVMVLLTQHSVWNIIGA